MTQFKPIHMAGIALAAALIAPSMAAGARAGRDILPPFSDQSAWSVSDSRRIDICITELNDCVANTFGASIFKVDGSDWHASITERKPIDLIDGHRYTLRLLARANTSRDIRVVALSTDRDHRNVGLDAVLPIGFGYQQFTESFVARDTNGRPATIVFPVGQTTGLVWLQAATLIDDGPSASSAGAA